MGRALILYVKEVSYPILAAFGFPANVLTAAILCRGKCGLTKGITRYMLAMAMSGLLVIIFHVLLQGIYGYYYPNSFLSLTAVCPSDVYLRIVTLDYSVWLTVSFTFDRFVSICCPKLRLTYCTDRTAVTVIVSMCALSCIKYIPFQFMYEPRFTRDNVNWGCWPKAAYLTSIWWIMFSWLCSISLSFLPFLLILFFNGLTIRNIVAASRVRRRLKGVEGNDTEAENRRKSIVLLFTVSGAHIVLWTTETVTFVCTRATVSTADGNHTSPSYIAYEVGVLLIYVNSCANTCIYGMTQKKFREEVKNGISHVTRFLSNLFKLVRM